MVFELAGVSFYFGYGMQNSKLNAHYKRKEERLKGNRDHNGNNLEI